MRKSPRRDIPSTTKSIPVTHLPLTLTRSWRRQDAACSTSPTQARRSRSRQATSSKTTSCTSACHACLALHQFPHSSRPPPCNSTLARTTPCDADVDEGTSHDDHHTALARPLLQRPRATTTTLRSPGRHQTDATPLAFATELELALEPASVGACTCAHTCACIRAWTHAACLTTTRSSCC